MKKFWLRIAGPIMLIFLLAGAMLGVLAVLDLTEPVLGRYTPSMFFAEFMGILFAAALLMCTNNEIGLFQFDPALGAAGHLPFRFILALTEIGLVYLWYGRRPPFLAPAPELARSWTDLKV